MKPRKCIGNAKKAYGVLKMTKIAEYTKKILKHLQQAFAELKNNQKTSHK